MKIAGLDLSLKGLGAVVVPGDWDFSFSRIARASFGRSLPKTATEREITDRLILLSHDITVWLSRQKATHVYVESLPTQRAWHLVPLAELRGVLRVELRRELAVDVAIANQTSVRHLLLGGLPKGLDRKAAIKEALDAAGANFDDHDQRDAFVVANWGMREQGVPHLQELLMPMKVAKAKKPRAQKVAA